MLRTKWSDLDIELYQLARDREGWQELRVGEQDIDEQYDLDDQINDLDKQMRALHEAMRRMEEQEGGNATLHSVQRSGH